MILHALYSLQILNKFLSSNNIKLLFKSKHDKHIVPCALKLTFLFVFVFIVKVLCFYYRTEGMCNAFRVAYKYNTLWMVNCIVMHIRILWSWWHFMIVVKKDIRDTRQNIYNENKRDLSFSVSFFGVCGFSESFVIVRVNMWWS